MFLHIGKDKVIPTSEIIAIIDANSSKSSSEMKNFIKRHSENEYFNDVEDSYIKSYIITCKEEKTNIYTSNISSSTLRKRWDNIKYI